jgi:hypothetical protein
MGLERQRRVRGQLETAPTVVDEVEDRAEAEDGVKGGTVSEHA